jgi:hypothetical protein
MARKTKKQKLPAYFAWRAGRPRWVPGPKLRAKGWRGRDLKDHEGQWLGYGAAIEAAIEINEDVERARAAGDGSGPRRTRAPRNVERSCRQLYELWIATPEYQKLGSRTRADYDNKAQIFLAEFGAEPVAALGRKILKFFWR